MPMHCDDADQIERSNDQNRDKIAQWRDQHGRVWLGKIVSSAPVGSPRETPPLREWDGSAVADFDADFILTEHDAELERMMCERRVERATDGRRTRQLEAIIDRVAALGGESLIWLYYDEETAERTSRARRRR
jgi:hypothetical protein